MKAEMIFKQNGTQMYAKNDLKGRNWHIDSLLPFEK